MEKMTIKCSVCGHNKPVDEFKGDIYSMIVPEDAICKQCEFERTVVECSLCHKEKTQDHFEVEFAYMADSDDAICNECKRKERTTTVRLLEIETSFGEVYGKFVYYRGGEASKATYFPLKYNQRKLSSIMKALSKRRSNNG